MSRGAETREQQTRKFDLKALLGGGKAEGVLFNNRRMHILAYVPFPLEHFIEFVVVNTDSERQGVEFKKLLATERARLIATTDYFIGNVRRSNLPVSTLHRQADPLPGVYLPHLYVYGDARAQPEPITEEGFTNRQIGALSVEQLVKVLAPGIATDTLNSMLPNVREDKFR